MVRKIMQMLAYRYIIISILLSACAQVGSISGGPKDVIPPRIVSCSPFDGQKMVKSTQMTIEFDEFIKLQKPSENIILLPANIEYDFILKGKTLRIEFQENLKENTTYSLYLNGAVQDITEGNDTLIQVAFSTGKEIDNNEAYFFVSDGYSGKQKKNVFIGLYDSIGQTKPTYFSKTDDNGYSKLRAIKEGRFFYAAFIDENKNRIKDNDEIQFASTQSILLDSTYSDALNLFVTQPNIQLSSIDATYITPYIVEIKIPQYCSFNDLKFNEVKSDVLDSLSYGEKTRRFIFPRYTEAIELELDTLNKKLRNDKDIEELTLIESFKKLKLFPDESSIILDFNAPIDSLRFDQNDFSLMNIMDSTIISLDSSQINVNLNRLELNIKDQTFKKAILRIDSAAFYAQNGSCNNKMNILLERKSEEDLGSLSVKVDTELESWFIELLQNDKSISTQTSFSKSHSILFENIEPGSYSISIVGDENKNNRWDPFNPFDYSGPEKRFVLGRAIKVKANWEHEVDFKIIE